MHTLFGQQMHIKNNKTQDITLRFSVAENNNEECLITWIKRKTSGRNMINKLYEATKGSLDSAVKSIMMKSM